MNRTSIATLALVLAIVAAALAGAGAAAAQESGNETENSTANDTEGNASVPGATVSNTGEEYTLEELRRGGSQPSGSPPSVRLANERMFWVIHWPAGSFGADVGDPQDSNWEYLERDGLVDRNSVYLRSIKTEAETEEVTVKVAYYQVGEREVERGNETITEQYPTDLVIDSHEVTVSQGWLMEEISLRQSNDQRMVTMWIEGQESDLRWTFRHESVATTQSAGIDTEGDYLYRAGTEFLLPIFIGSFIIGLVCKGAIKRAGVGPQWGYFKWILLLSIATGLFVASQFRTVADLVTIAPYVAAAFIVGVVGIVILETYTTNLKRAEFVKPEIEDAVSPSGEKAVDMQRAESTEEMIVKLENGRTAVVRRGLLPFLSRCFGGAAVLEGSEKIKTTVDVVDSRVDEKYFVDPSADEILEYEPESWTLEVPELEDRDELVRYGIAGLVLVAIGATVASSLATSWGLGVMALGALAMLARPTMGHARIKPAPAHMRSAWASAMYLNKEYEEARTIEQARERNVKLQAANERDVEEALEEQDRTLIESMFDPDISRAIDPEPERVETDHESVTIEEEVSADD